MTLRERITGFVGDNWQWLWAALIVPLLGLAAGFVKARRYRRDEEVETSYVQGPRNETWLGRGRGPQGALHTSSQNERTSGM